MTTPLVECIPNFSEARRPDVVDAIQESISSVSGVYVLDRHSDEDHNRTVITFVGPPEEVEVAAFNAIAKAAELIDLDKHTGQHPRIGASDVVPFVPISGISMNECVEMAKRVGHRVGDELGIPVYLYEEAATQPSRRNLANIRRGEYEKLKEEITTNPERAPDYGPSQVGPAGATVIGARQFLIAFNVYLTSDDVSIAKKIASAVRHSSGGLRYVKALGLLVEGRAQVSMNLTNFRKTPIARVVEFIRREAERYGVGVLHSELVGLIPQAALVDAAVWYAQMDLFKDKQVLENRLYAVQSDGTGSAGRNGELDGWDFLGELAAGTPTPGGGSASAYAGAMAAGLIVMVARLTVGKKKYVDVKEKMGAIFEEAERLRVDLSAAVEQDASAFDALMAAFKLPKDDPQRSTVIHDATLHAAQVPLDVVRFAVRAMELAVQVMKYGNLNAITDAGTAAALAHAALSGAGYNVRINLLDMKVDQVAGGMLAELNLLQEKARLLMEDAEVLLAERGGIRLI